MATQKIVMEKILEKLLPLDINARAMFGEYGLYFQGKVVGFICDDTLFIKITEAGEALAPRIVKGFPYPGAKPHLKISATRLGNHEWIAQLLLATAEALPAPKTKKKRTPKRA